jgi:hypothetical protein
MNMTEFTDKQLAVMAEESSPRGLSARKEIERRSKQQKGVVETPVQEETPSQKDTEQENPKRNTRRKRNTKQEESE